MFVLLLLCSGDYDSFVMWTNQCGSQIDRILDEQQLTMVNDDVSGEPYDTIGEFTIEWWVTGDANLDLDDFRVALSKSIHEFLETNEDANEFTIDKIKHQ